MFTREVFLVFTLLQCLASGANECFNVQTSEGSATLQDGQTACAALDAGETPDDKGKRFLTCSYGIVHTQACSANLRYDTISKTCTWSDVATCYLEGVSRPDSTTTATSYTPTYASSSLPGSTTDPRSTTTQLPTTTPPQGSCNSDNCKLPNCFCYGARPPIALRDTPMFLVLTFDDAVTTTVFDYYRQLLIDNTYNIFNPNGCPARAAFYVNHDYTDYSLVKVLADKGNEIASHTVNHSLPQGDSSSDYPEAVAQICGMRDKVLQGTQDKSISDSMVGFRAPYLRVAYNIQFDALRDCGFLYDTSITNVETFVGRDPLWPFTLDYVMPRCTNLPCPTNVYPGLWEFPINGWIGSTNYSCSMIDTCSVGSNIFTATEDEWYTFYKRNFDDFFYPVKVPMHLFTHASMFLRSPPSFPAMVSWFQDLQLTHKDVWLVTPKQVIEWMQNPLTNSEMIAKKWGCS